MSEYNLRYKQKYQQEVVQKMMDEFQYKSVTVSYTHLTLPTKRIV